MSSALKIHRPNGKQLSSLVDQLGELKAEIATLQEKENELKEQIRESKESEIEGKLFRVTISRSDRTTTDYKSLIEKLKVKDSVLKRYQSSTEVVTIKVTSRQSE